MKNLLSCLILIVLFTSCKKNEPSNTAQVSIETESNDMFDEHNMDLPDIKVMPISHATFAMTWDDQVFYFDPTGGATAFEGLPAATLIFVTDIHGDHMNVETLKAVKNESNTLFTPQAVADKLDADLSATIISNGESQTVNGITITAVPMYNITEGRLNKHVKGRGNGYILEKDGYSVYVSGDTEGIPEMRNLKDIDKAFICMNLPYTMDVEQAADAVLEFAPKEVLPYHYRGSGGFSDVEKFKALVNQGDNSIEVTLLEWYPTASK